MAKVVPLKTRRPAQALEHLNRLTGLDFQRWPESLLPGCEREQPSTTVALPAQEHRQ